MKSNNLLFLTGIIFVTLLISAGIINLSFGEKDRGSEDYSYDKDYRYGDENDNYEKDYRYGDEKQKLIIEKDIFICPNNSNEIDCSDIQNWLNCEDDPTSCQDLGITNADFQIDILPSITPSDKPTEYYFDFSSYRVTEIFPNSLVGELVCLFAGFEGDPFETGGIINTASGDAVLVCANFKGDCSGSFDSKYSKLYEDGVKEDRVCVVENYVAPSQSLQDTTMQISQLFTSEIPSLSKMNFTNGTDNTIK